MTTTNAATPATEHTPGPRFSTDEDGQIEQPCLHNEDDGRMTIVFKLTDRKLLDALYEAFKSKAEYAIGKPCVLSWGDMSDTVESMEAYIESLEDAMSSGDLQDARLNFKTKCAAIARARNVNPTTP